MIPNAPRRAPTEGRGPGPPQRARPGTTRRPPRSTGAGRFRLRGKPSAARCPRRGALAPRNSHFGRPERGFTWGVTEVSPRATDAFHARDGCVPIGAVGDLAGDAGAWTTLISRAMVTGIRKARTEGAFARAARSGRRTWRGGVTGDGWNVRSGRASPSQVTAVRGGRPTQAISRRTTPRECDRWALI